MEAIRKHDYVLYDVQFINLGVQERFLKFS